MALHGTCLALICQVTLHRYASKSCGGFERQHPLDVVLCYSTVALKEINVMALVLVCLSVFVCCLCVLTGVPLT